MTTAADLESAERLYRRFREQEPYGQPIRRPTMPAALARLGTCEFVGYITTHANQAALYVHYFAPGSRPGLYANSGRGQLYFIGGRFRVSYRGITDISAAGREIDFKPRYVTLTLDEFRRTLRGECPRRYLNLLTRRGRRS